MHFPPPWTAHHAHGGRREAGDGTARYGRVTFAEWQTHRSGGTQGQVRTIPVYFGVADCAGQGASVGR
jgi:hypothetical protein